MLKKKITKKPFIVIYGREGVGKTTLASLFPKPAVVDAECRYYYDIPNVQVSKYEQLNQALLWAMNAGDTVVIDSVDAVQEMCFTYVMNRNNLKSLTQNYKEAITLVCQEMAFKFFNQLREINNSGKTVVCVCHPKMIEVQDAMVAGKWNAYTLKLADCREVSLSARLKEISDGLFFLTHDSPAEIEKKTAQPGNDIRRLFTEYSPCYDAKNIWGLPDPVIDADVYGIYEKIRPYIFPESEEKEPKEQPEFNRKEAFEKALSLFGGNADALKAAAENAGVSFKNSAPPVVKNFIRRVELLGKINEKLNDDPTATAMALAQVEIEDLEKAGLEQLEKAVELLHPEEIPY